ncbi:ZYRO0C11396p [Zygosaccharomyces rouxii]|uniref:ZYRO0C11396p n=1 Tax=Zygosaccharomyces rouxii (strain ATCC 2623 / CBS 732 / NBRC 1130 / NCYC 568 / NRRL Y-229) TaxID=559307 RepID=C5DTU5_ZYGRC|nr:uncharacterized protein ZYRO0C11396g [Zygosaccharomyces rouxii]KAH9201619.1 hypothetical protein LQ764DRAFT_81970 [Zygosaccharomyces rouxii]CAR27206.1 ZYRO0C11396p [Zygosaccharomyces rouxii]
MSDKEVESVSKPELKVEQMDESKNEIQGSNEQESKLDNTLEKFPSKDGNESDTKTATLKSPVSVGVPKKDEKEEKKDDNKKVNNDDEEEAPPLPTRRKPLELPGESSSKAFPEKMENPILKQLKEAFPNIEENYVKAVIIASQGVLEPAFHALLFLSDPDSGKDIELPSQPLQAPPAEPLPQRRQSQLEQDEMLARQLDEKYNRRRSRKTGISGGDGEDYDRRQRLRDRQRRMQSPISADEYREIYGDEEEPDMWGQLVDKDLPELRTRANRSIQDTATKLNGWFNGISKKLYGDQEEPETGRRLGDNLRQEPPKKPERRRFNSFGAQIGDDSTLESHGITLQNDEEELDVPPQLKNRKQPGVDLVAQTTYIDSPEHSQRKKWQPVPPAPVPTSPTRHGNNALKSPDDDDFLLNSEDEL